MGEGGGKIMEYLIVGKIVNTHGVHGELKILPLTDDINRFKKLKNVLIERINEFKEFRIESVKIMNSFIILKLEDINDLDNAKNYKDCYLKIDKSNAVKLPKDSYFISDIIGMQVKTIDGEELGNIKDVLQPGGNDVYIVENNGRDLMIPAVKEFINSIDLEQRLIIVKLIEGLKEL